MALEIEVHTLTEQLRPDDRVDHTHDFRAFFINGGRVEIVDFAIFARTYRMGEWSGIFWELLRF